MHVNHKPLVHACSCLGSDPSKTHSYAGMVVLAHITLIQLLPQVSDGGAPPYVHHCLDSVADNLRYLHSIALPVLFDRRLQHRFQRVCRLSVCDPMYGLLCPRTRSLHCHATGIDTKPLLSNSRTQRMAPTHAHHEHSSVSTSLVRLLPCGSKRLHLSNSVDVVVSSCERRTARPSTVPTDSAGAAFKSSD